MKTANYLPLNYEKVKGMWLSQFDLGRVYFSEGKQRDKSEFTSLMERILDNCVELGVNTVFVQIRPNGDSMYPSKVYPASKYVVGAYGNSHEYDPFAIILELAHSRKLSLQAWINPMRLMLKNEIVSVEKDYRIAQWYNGRFKGQYVLEYENGCFLNPAYSEARQLVIDGVAEICELYDVDGVHMDDYFYPTTDAAFDAEAYEKFGEGKELGDFRRNNLNILVSGIYETVKKANGKLLFGISPAGRIREVYAEQYADIYTWCANEGYIDYILPQVYFGMEHSSAAVPVCTGWWADAITCPKVKLFVGFTLSKALAGAKGMEDQWAATPESKREWINHRDVMKRSIEHVRDKVEKCEGVVFFCYNYFFNPITGEEIPELKEEKEKFLPVYKSLWN